MKNGPRNRATNAYQTGDRKVVPACLVYARRDGLVLMVHRNTGREDDIHRGKWNGLGGKFEPGESPAEAARREFHEEAGVRLPAKAFCPLGVLQFPEFKAAAREDWIVYVFEARLAAGRAKPGLLKSTREGDLHWIREREVPGLPLWEGDREFLPFVLARRPFIGTYWYSRGRLLRSWLAPL